MVLSLDSLFLKYETLPNNLDIRKRDIAEKVVMLVSAQNSEIAPYNSVVFDS
jgi:hypothetical protein